MIELLVEMIDFKTDREKWGHHFSNCYIEFNLKKKKKKIEKNAVIYCNFEWCFKNLLLLIILFDLICYTTMFWKPITYLICFTQGTSPYPCPDTKILMSCSLNIFWFQKF